MGPDSLTDSPKPDLTLHYLNGDCMPEAGPGTDIVLDGDKFSYKRTTPDGAIVITCTGIVKGDTFTGTVDLGGFAQAPYTGVRIKPRDAPRD